MCSRTPAQAQPARTANAQPARSAHRQPARAAHAQPAYNIGFVFFSLLRLDELNCLKCRC
jgi:hypothetical protein